MRTGRMVHPVIYRHNSNYITLMLYFFFQAEDGIRDLTVTGVQTCALPIFAQIDGLPVLARPQGLRLEIEIDPPGERVRYDQGWRREVVGPHFLLDAALEVAVPREHRAHHQLPLGDRGGHGLGKRPRVPDAGRAAVAH